MSGPTWTTRAQLRADLAGRLNDYVPLSWGTLDPTILPAPSNLTFYDPVGLAVSGNSYAARQALVTAGHPLNVGLVRRVVTNNPDGPFGGSITLSSALPAPFTPDSRLELYDKRSVGVRVEEYHAAIDRAIRAAGDSANLPEEFEVAPTFDGSRRLTIPLPDDWISVHNVQTPRTDAYGGTGWVDAKVGKRPGESGWSLDLLADGTAVVVVTGGPGWWWPSDWSTPNQYGLAAPATVRVEGMKRPAPLTKETDSTPVEYGWLMEHALSQLLMASSEQRSDRQQWERQGYVREENARTMRAQGMVRRSGRRNSRRIPGR